MSGSLQKSTERTRGYPVCEHQRSHPEHTLGHVGVSRSHAQELCVPGAASCSTLKQKQVENTSLPKLLCCSREAAIEIQETKLRDAEC